MRVSPSSMNGDMGVGSRPNGQHGGLRHRFSLRRVMRAKGVAKNCVANFALDRRRIGASPACGPRLAKDSQALWLPPGGFARVGEMAQVIGRALHGRVD